MYSASRILRAFWWLMFGKSWQRRRVRHECARFAASLFGDYPVSDDYKLWREDKEFIGQYKNLLPGNYFTQDRKFTRREFIRTNKDIPASLTKLFSQLQILHQMLRISSGSTDGMRH